MKFLSFTLAGSLLGLIACAEAPKSLSLHDFGFFNNSANMTLPTISVGAPTWLADNRLRYRLLYADPTQVRFYAFDQWLASPAELFEQFLVNSGLFGTQPIQLKLLQFEQQFISAQQAKVILHFTAELQTETSAKPKVSVFKLEQPCSPDAQGALSGLNALVRQAALRLQVWLGENAESA